MAVARVVINDAALAKLLHGQDGVVARGMADIGRLIQNEAKRRCPVDEGRLRASITSATLIQGNTIVTRVGTVVEYALMVHNGTGIYGPAGKMIVPTRVTGKNGRPAALRWKPGKKGGGTPGKDGFIYAKSVRGQRPNPFLTDALRAVLQPLGWPIIYKRPTGGPRG